MKDILEVIANISAVLTLFGGIFAWCYYQYGFCRKKRALEEYLKKQFEIYKKYGGSAVYQFSFLHLTAELGLTESEILQASFNSRFIKRVEKSDKDGFTEKILFEYKEGISN